MVVNVVGIKHTEKNSIEQDKNSVTLIARQSHNLMGLYTFLNFSWLLVASIKEIKKNCFGNVHVRGPQKNVQNLY